VPLARKPAVSPAAAHRQYRKCRNWCNITASRHAPAAARAACAYACRRWRIRAFDARARLHLLASVATHMLQHHTRRAGGGVYIIGLEVYSIAGRLSTNPRLPVLSVRDLCE
jgi:hypothetical protein